MALDEQGNPIPGTIDALGSLQWPPPEWGYTVPAPLETTLGPRGTGSTIDPVPPPPPPPPPPEPGNGRKGGSSSGPSRSGTEQVGPLLSQGGEEVPFGAPPGPPAAPDLPPLPPPAVDAVSGPGAMPPMPSDAQPQMPASYLSDDEAAVAKGYNAPTDTVAGLSDENLGRAIANLPPEEQAVLQQKHEAAKANFVASRMLEESQRTLEQQQQNAAAYQQAQQRAQQQTDQIMLESDRLASVPTDRNRWANRSAPTAIAGLLGAIVGGLMQPYTGGRNSGLDALLGMVDKDVDDQKFDAEQKRQGLSARGNLVAEQLQRSGNMYQAAETVRLSHYQTIINGLQAEAQKFDPRGTTAMNIAQSIQGVRARQAQAAQALFQQNLKDEAERAKIDLDKANAAKARADAAKTRGETGGAGAGAGSATNANYSVATGIFSPYDNAPVMGKRVLGKKGGADEKEFERVNAQIGTYAHVQDYWQKLRDVGAKVEYHKSLGESAWSKLKNTDAAEYDAAKEALTVYLTKELGDKLTAGQLEAQAHRIPDRASLLESRDPGKQIADAQEDADRDFVRDMNEVGINGTPIVQHAQQKRAPAPVPSGTDAYGAASQALAGARTPTEKRDAQTALSSAEEQIKAEKQAETEGKAAVVKLSGLYPHPKLPEDGLPPALAAAVSGRNEDADTYNQRLKQAHGVEGDVPKVDPKLKGEAAKVQRDHEKLLDASARKVALARAALDHSDAHVADALIQHLGESNFGGLPPAKVAVIAKHLGVDPSTLGDDMGGQVLRGEFEAKLRKLDPAGRQKLVKWFFGEGK